MKKWVWLAMFFAAAGGGVLWWVHAKGAGTPPGPPARPRPIPVTAASALQGDMPVHFIGLGSVVPHYTVTVHTRVDGQLLAVYYREGQFVHAGDLLAELDPRPFQVQLEQAEAQMEHDQAVLANARVDLSRFAALAKTGAIPSQQYDTQVATVKQDEAQIKVDQAAIDNARLQLAYCRITAPISGRIGLRLVDPGNIIHVTDVTGLMVITQMQPATVIFALPESELLTVAAKRRAGQALRVDALSRDLTTVLDSGHLLAVDNQINQNTGTGNLRAVFPNRNSGLFPNQFVNARILVDMLHRQVIIPSVAVQRGPEGPFVWVVRPDRTVQVRKIVVGVVEGTSAAAASGLAVGETVVTDGFENLRPGSRVVILPAGSPERASGSSPGGRAFQ
jgi:multidrug efflux system membrane fusion protein